MDLSQCAAMQTCNFKNLIREAHHLIEAKEACRITQKEMASRIGVKHRTYMEYERSGKAPLAIAAFMNMLNQLDDHEVLRIIRKWPNVQYDQKQEIM